MYFRANKGQRMSHRDPEIPPMSPLIIEESPRDEERIRETILKEQLQMAHAKNIALKEQLQQKWQQVATMADLCIEAF